MTDTLNCKNCGTVLSSDFKYCPECGQKTNESLTLGVLFNNTISNYFSVDARFFKSFVPLVFKPGFLPQKFIQGKRLTYLHPAQFYLFVSVVFFFIFSFSVREQNQTFDAALQNNFKLDKAASIDSTLVQKALDSLSENNSLKPLYDKEIVVGKAGLKQLDSILKSKPDNSNEGMFLGFNKKKVDSLLAVSAPNSEIYKAMGMPDDAGFIKKRMYKQGLKLYKNRAGGILGAFYDTIPIAMFFLLPLFALILKLFFYKCGSYAHHLVFSFYYFSFVFVLLSFVLLLNYSFEIPEWVYLALLFLTFIYLSGAVRRFYEKGVFESVFKSGLIVFIYIWTVIPVALFIMGLVTFMFY